MKEFWNARYSEEGWAYGIKPNEFFKDQLIQLPVGKLLLPAEGEGRNALFAAKLGWDVDAYDQSEAGQQKALNWAKREGIALNYEVGDLTSLDLGNAIFDAAAMVFTHFPPPVKARIHHSVAAALKHGGIIILEGFSKHHLAFNTTN